MLSSQGRYNHFDTTPYKQISDAPENCLSIIAVSGRKIKCGFCKLRKTEERTSDSGGPGGKSPPGLLHFSIGRWCGKRLLIQPPQITQQHHAGDHERGSVGNWGGPCDAANACRAVKDGHQRHIEAALAE